MFAVNNEVAIIDVCYDKYIYQDLFTNNGLPKPTMLLGHR